ncbi:hypothetical protein ACFW2E_28585, partial [Streptomyces sp. NPDC058964]
MVTFAQAQERAEEWINGDVPAYQHREVRVREFGLGFVVWGEDRAEGPRSDAGAQRLVIARDSGEATLWPALPVGEVIRRYEEEYGREDEVQDAVPAPAARVDLNQTSFLLSPPEWLQEAADKLGIADRRSGGGLPETQAGVPTAAAAEPADAPRGAAVPAPAAPAGSAGGVAPGNSGASWPAAGGGEPGDGAHGVSAGATPWAGTDTNGDAGDDRSVPLPATVFAPPLSDADNRPAAPSTPPDAETALMSGGSQLPPTAIAPALGGPGAPQGSTPPPPAPGAQPYGYPQAAAAPGTPPGAGQGTPPYPQGHAAPGTPPAPPVPGAPQGHTPPPAPGASSYGYPQGPGAPSVPGGPQGAPGYGYPQGPDGAPDAPRPPAGPGVPGRPLAPNASDIADAATSKAAPPPRRARGGAGAPPPPPGVPGAPGARPAGMPAPGAPGEGGGYVPTQIMSALGPD